MIWGRTLYEATGLFPKLSPYFDKKEPYILLKIFTSFNIPSFSHFLISSHQHIPFAKKDKNGGKSQSGNILV
jgi:hypothetical protein